MQYNFWHIHRGVLWDTPPCDLHSICQCLWTLDMGSRCALRHTCLETCTGTVPFTNCNTFMCACLAPACNSTLFACRCTVPVGNFHTFGVTCTVPVRNYHSARAFAYSARTVPVRNYHSARAFSLLKEKVIFSHFFNIRKVRALW